MCLFEAYLQFCISVYIYVVLLRKQEENDLENNITKSMSRSE